MLPARDPNAARRTRDPMSPDPSTRMNLAPQLFSNLFKSCRWYRLVRLVEVSWIFGWPRQYAHIKFALSITIMKGFFRIRYIIPANCSTTTQPINPGQTLYWKPICAPSWPFNHHLQILLHHRESSPESDFCHVNFMWHFTLWRDFREGQIADVCQLQSFKL